MILHPTAAYKKTPFFAASCADFAEGYGLKGVCEVFFIESSGFSWAAGMRVKE